MGLECSTIKSPRKRAAEWEHLGWVKCTNLEKETHKTYNIAQYVTVLLVQRLPGLQKSLAWWLETMTAIHHFIRGIYLRSIILFYFYTIHRLNIKTID